MSDDKWIGGLHREEVHTTDEEKAWGPSSLEEKEAEKVEHNFVKHATRNTLETQTQPGALKATNSSATKRNFEKGIETFGKFLRVSLRGCVPKPWGKMSVGKKHWSWVPAQVSSKFRRIRLKNS